jgi:cell division protein DivIC
MSFLSLIPSWLKNKYLLATVFFCTWMLFFDHNDLGLQMERRRELNDLRAGKEYYQKRIEETQKELQNLQLNAASVEKVAREKYLMKKDNEDLFVITEKN